LELVLESSFVCTDKQIYSREYELLWILPAISKRSCPSKVKIYRWISFCVKKFEIYQSVGYEKSKSVVNRWSPSKKSQHYSYDFSMYQSHYVVTKKNGQPFIDFHKVVRIFNEIVIDQESQVVPIFSYWSGKV